MQPIPTDSIRPSHPFPFCQEVTMGLLDKITGSVFGALSGGGQNSQLAGTVLGLLNDPRIGGLAGLVQGFRDKGLGQVVDSWVGTGKNLPVSADQIRQGLDPQVLQQVAGSAGVKVEEVAGQLANFLPGLVDKLTPQGSIPDSPALQKGIELLKGKFGIR